MLNYNLTGSSRLFLRIQDAEVASDNERIVKETVDNLTGLDIIIGNAGWTRFARPGDIYDLSHEEWTKVCTAIFTVDDDINSTVLDGKCSGTFATYANSQSDF